jgi:hypothetical protein
VFLVCSAISDVFLVCSDSDGLWRLAHSNLLAFPELMPFEDTTNTKMAMAYQVTSSSQHPHLVLILIIFTSSSPHAHSPHPIRIVLASSSPHPHLTLTSSLILSQVNGLAFDQFYNNTVLTTRAEVYDCGASKGYPMANVSNMRDNRILYLGNFTAGAAGSAGSTGSATGSSGSTGSTGSHSADHAAGSVPFVQDGCAHDFSGSFADWQALGFDAGSTLTASALSVPELLAMITRWLPK